MKKMHFLIGWALILILTASMFGCVSTGAKVFKDIVLSTEDYTFIIRSNKKEHNHINVAVVTPEQITAAILEETPPMILEEIQKKGYKAEIVTLNNQVHEQQPEALSGSGFFISEDGVLITNAHVVKNASRILLRTMDGAQKKAEVIVRDLNNDVAVLRTLEPIKVKYWLPIKPFKNSHVGDHITIIGYPLTNILGSHPRVTAGIISSDVGLMDNPTRFQVSASIQPGNSGGPILKDDFHVIGIATEKLSDSFVFKATGSIPQNVNFGVKIDYTSLLFDEDIERSIKSKEPSITSLDDAIKATALITANIDKLDETIEKSSSKRGAIIVTFEYAFAQPGTQVLSIDFTDLNTGELIVRGYSSGFIVYRNAIRHTLQKMFQSIEH